MTTTVYDRRNLDEPVRVQNLFNGRSVATIQAPFLLTEADFMRLKGSPPRTATASTVIFSAAAGYGVGLVPRLLPLISGGHADVSAAETWTLGIAFMLATAIYFLGMVLPSERRSVMKRIATHFAESRPSIHVIEGHQ